MKNTEKALEVLLDTGMKVVNALEDDGKSTSARASELP